MKGALKVDIEFRLAEQVADMRGRAYIVYRELNYEGLPHENEQFVDDVKATYNKIKVHGEIDDSCDALHVLFILLSIVDAHLAIGNQNEALSCLVSASNTLGQLEVQIGMETPAQNLARLRHAENYALANDALKYWREKIDPNLSASKAANELIGVVPLSHKKLAELVSAEKKKQP